MTPADLTTPSGSAQGPASFLDGPPCPVAPDRATWWQNASTGGRVAGRLAFEVGRLGFDRLAAGRPVPAGVTGVDAAVLSRLLGGDVRATEVLDATIGTTDRCRLRLTGDDVPTSVFVKTGPRSFVPRLFGNLIGLGHDEVAFYRDIRPGLVVDAPQALGLAVDPPTGRFVLVLEDLAARGCTFHDLIDGLAPETAARAVRTLAALHGAGWRDRRLTADRTGPWGWLAANRDPRTLDLFSVLMPGLVRALVKRDADLVPPDGRAILDAYGSVTRALDAGPQTVLHGDPHPGNWYVDDDQPGLLDWQAVRRGHPMRDVTYFLVLALTPDVRRAHQRELLEVYAEALAAAGGPALDRDEVWAAHRAMAAYTYIATTVTSAVGGLQSVAIVDEGLRRALVAIDELRTARALGLR